MELEIYNTANAVNIRARTDVNPVILFTDKGRIRFTDSFCKLFNITEGFKIEFGQNKKDPTEWFFRINEDARGFKFKITNRGTFIYSAEIARKLLKSLNCFQPSISVVVSTKKNEQGWYAIITQANLNSTNE